MSGGHPLDKNKKGGKKAIKKGNKKGKTDKELSEELHMKYVGCTGREGDLGADKEYGGGSTGANAFLARSLAWDKGAKYVAIARSGVDGHSFTFNKKMKRKPALDDSGCSVPCADSPEHKCGCSDGACGGLGPVAGEEHTRRWVVYKVKPKPKRIAGEEDDEEFGNYRGGSDVEDDE